MKLTIPIEPQPQPRPRVTARGTFAHAYEPIPITLYKRMIASTYQKHLPIVKPDVDDYVKAVMDVL